LKVTCDNAGGQNKNNTIIWFYLYLVIAGYYESIELNFMVPGHTKFKCDGSFGLIKRLYHNTRVDCIDHMVEMVKSSSISRLNKARHYNGREAFQYYHILSSLVTFFRKLPHMQRFQHILFPSASRGVVQAQEAANGPFQEFKLLKASRFEAAEAIEKIMGLSFPVLMSPPMKYERQNYLYNYIRPFVTDEFKDVTCPKPVVVGNTNED
jgi:hypothetical protein